MEVVWKSINIIQKHCIEFSKHEFKKRGKELKSKEVASGRVRESVSENKVESNRRKHLMWPPYACTHTYWHWNVLLKRAIAVIVGAKGSFK